MFWSYHSHLRLLRLRGSDCLTVKSLHTDYRESQFLSLNPLDPIEFGIPHFLTMSLVFPKLPIFMPVPLVLESSFQTLKVDNHPVKLNPDFICQK